MKKYEGMLIISHGGCPVPVKWTTYNMAGGVMRNIVQWLGLKIHGYHRKENKTILKEVFVQDAMWASIYFKFLF